MCPKFRLWYVLQPCYNPLARVVTTPVSMGCKLSVYPSHPRQTFEFRGVLPGLTKTRRAGGAGGAACGASGGAVDAHGANCGSKAGLGQWPRIPPKKRTPRIESSPSRTDLLIPGKSRRSGRTPSTSGEGSPASDTILLSQF